MRTSESQHLVVSQSKTLSFGWLGSSLRAPRFNTGGSQARRPPPSPYFGPLAEQHGRQGWDVNILKDRTPSPDRPGKTVDALILNEPPKRPCQ